MVFTAVTFCVLVQTVYVGCFASTTSIYHQKHLQGEGAKLETELKMVRLHRGKVVASLKDIFIQGIIIPEFGARDV